ncbi:hypothetical protein [Enterobacter asburiae]|uniref:hypothetical protein n=1 Tax=Enterobacter asburiae TaxID=61645 RepID=UPI000F86AE5F|nr:hypothetical protein [Enterobacter asburiae]RTP91510.1 hypothetical protein EKN34_03155 [Enterobacter asburiae]
MLKDYLSHIGNTLFGMYQHPFSKDWDQILNQLLDEGECLFVEEYTAAFWLDGDVYRVWLKNHRFGYANLYQFNENPLPSVAHVRPRFRTMRRLHRFACEFHREAKQ